jgi:acetyl esterase/lipase
VAYPIPARADSYAGLPPAYLSVGSAEVFRDEVVSYADRLWRAGGSAELHVWNGAPHAFEALAPEARVTRASLGTKLSWLARIGCLGSD